MRGRLKHQRVNAHREAAQFNGLVSGRPASAWGKAIARLGPPDTTFFVSSVSPSAKVTLLQDELASPGQVKEPGNGGILGRNR
jgi:hypothetical protein